MTRRARRGWLLALLLLLLWPVPAGTQGTVIPDPSPQFFDSNGDPCNGCLLNAYQAGTTTRQNVYSDSALTVAHTNPVVLNSAGRPPSNGQIFLSATTYRFVLTNSTGGTTYWDADNVTSIPTTSGNVDITGTAGETLTAGDLVYLSDGSGSLTAGRWYKADADNTYSALTPQIGVATTAISSAATGTVRIAGRVTGLSSLTAGATYYVSATAGALTATAPTHTRLVGAADTTSTLVLAPNPPVTTTDITGTAGEALAVRDVVYLSDGSGSLTAGRWYKADADLNYRSSTAGLVGVVPAAISSGESGSIRLSGRLTGFTGLTAGAAQYVSATAGGVTGTAPTLQRFVGVADSTTTLLLAPNPAKPRTGLNIVTKTATYTATTDDDVILCTSGTFTVTLYTAVGNAGKRIEIKNTGSGQITIDADGSETIDGAATLGPFDQYFSYSLVSDGANWIIV